MYWSGWNSGWGVTAEIPVIPRHWSTRERARIGATQEHVWGMVKIIVGTV